MSENEKKNVTDEELLEVTGGEDEKVRYVCQGCGKWFSEKKGKKFKGEPMCKKCR